MTDTRKMYLVKSTYVMTARSSVMASSQEEANEKAAKLQFRHFIPDRTLVETLTITGVEDYWKK